MNSGARILRGSKTENFVKPNTPQCYEVMHEGVGMGDLDVIHINLTNIPLTSLCFLCETAAVADKVDFLGMSVDTSGATAGQWILLVLAVLFLLTTILLTYKYRKSRKNKKSTSMMELK